jgi:hypothetical protein
LSEVEPNADEASATPIPPQALVNGSIAPGGDVDFYTFTVTAPGSLTLTVTPRNGSTLDGKLSLYAVDSYASYNGIPHIGGGGLLVVSDDQAPGNPNPLVNQFVLPGQYFVEVSAGGDGTTTGDYTLSTAFVPQLPPASVNPNPPSRVVVGRDRSETPQVVATADLNRDGIPDLVTVNQGSHDAGDVSVLLGNGDGTFQPQLLLPVPGNPSSVLVGDFNGDGRPDLAVLDSSAGTVSVFLGFGDGRFQQPPSSVALPGHPTALVGVDFNADGRPDLASLDGQAGVVTFIPGNGDGTFAAQDKVSFALPAGVHADAIAFAHFDPNGPLDMAALDAGTGQVTVFLGTGVGHFRQGSSFAVGGTPSALAAVDFNGDGRPDLAVLDNQVASGTPVATLIPGNGDGTFAVQGAVRRPAQDPTVVGLFDGPSFYVLGDFNRDGSADLVNLRYDPYVAGDFDRDGQLDIATLDTQNAIVTILPGTPDGGVRTGPSFTVPGHPNAILTFDFNQDHRLDLVLLDSQDGVVTFVPGNGDGTFAVRAAFQMTPQQLGIPSSSLSPPIANVIADTLLAVSGGLPPLRQAVVDYPPITGPLNGGPVDVTPYLASRDVFIQGDTNIPVPARATPQFVDLSGDGTADLLVVSRSGDILLRPGRPGQPGAFGAAEVVNADPADPRARAVSVVATGAGAELVAVDLGGTLSLYARQPDGGWRRTLLATAPPGGEPLKVAAVDLDGDGRPDLVVANEVLGTLSIYLGRPDGSFEYLEDVKVGVTVSDLALVDVNGDHRVDVVVTNQVSGNVGVLLNEGLPAGGVGFADETIFRAGAALDGQGNNTYGLEEGAISVLANQFLKDQDPALAGQVAFPPVYVGISPAETAAVAVADFTGDGVPDLVVTNRGTDSFALLPGKSGPGGQATGSFIDPHTFPLSPGSHPTAVAVGDFNGDGNLDLAILEEGTDTVSIWLGDGHGGFTEKVASGPDGQPLPLSAGNNPTGLTARDVNGTGTLDLVVGNEFGDVLTLRGNGDGTFQQYQRVDRHVGLAVADLQSNGQDDLVLTDKAQDQVSIQYARPGPSFVQDRSDGVLAPGGVRVADLNGDGLPDLVVANGGGNDVLVYLGVGGGQFSPTPLTFPAGTDPVSVTVADLTGDGTPDLVVANEGSDDLSILLGQGSGAGWTLTEGPRLKTHGLGPVATTTVQDPGGLPDILVTNSQSDNVALLQNLGHGFFNDQDPRTFPTGAVPVQPIVGRFTNGPGPDLATINSGSNTITLIPDFLAPAPVPVQISTGGETPVAAVAGDFNHNGFDDLAVANSGDGSVALLLGGPDGPTLAALLSSADVPHPDDVALSSALDGVIYVSDADREAVARFDLLTLAPPESPAGSGLPGPAAVPEVVARLLPVQETTLALVATLFAQGTEVGLAVVAPEGMGAAEGTLLAGALAGSETIDASAATPVLGGGSEEDLTSDNTTGGAAVTEEREPVPGDDARNRFINFLGGVDDRLPGTGPDTPDPGGMPAPDTEPVPKDAPPSAGECGNDEWRSPAGSAPDAHPAAAPPGAPTAGDFPSGPSSVTRAVDDYFRGSEDWAAGAEAPTLSGAGRKGIPAPGEYAEPLDGTPAGLPRDGNEDLVETLAAALLLCGIVPLDDRRRGQPGPASQPRSACPGSAA